MRGGLAEITEQVLAELAQNRVPTLPTVLPCVGALSGTVTMGTLRTWSPASNQLVCLPRTGLPGWPLCTWPSVSVLWLLLFLK